MLGNFAFISLKNSMANLKMWQILLAQIIIHIFVVIAIREKKNLKWKRYFFFM